MYVFMCVPSKGKHSGPKFVPSSHPRTITVYVVSLHGSSCRLAILEMKLTRKAIKYHHAWHGLTDRLIVPIEALQAGSERNVSEIMGLSKNRGDNGLNL